MEYAPILLARGDRSNAWELIYPSSPEIGRENVERITRKGGEAIYLSSDVLRAFYALSPEIRTLVNTGAPVTLPFLKEWLRYTRHAPSALWFNTYIIVAIVYSTCTLGFGLVRAPLAWKAAFFVGAFFVGVAACGMGLAFYGLIRARRQMRKHAQAIEFKKKDLDGFAPDTIA